MEDTKTNNFDLRMFSRKLNKNFLTMMASNRGETQTKKEKRNSQYLLIEDTSSNIKKLMKASFSLTKCWYLKLFSL